MKTIKNILAGLAIALIALSGSAIANTADSSYLAESTLAPIEEQYVNDIPFNTAKIAAEAQYQKAVQVQFTVPAEKDVDDIPFNTEKIAMNYLRHKALTQIFNVPKDKDVNDIPFNTEKVFESIRTSQLLLTNK
jgi:hypothetical protein